ncbi:MAG: Ferric transporter ATP-binding subunit [Rhodospirillales bacterium]|jgi:iron(III) transport system substrate-binding protein|nr:Ferric transporter ATP-binding subunit [Rhodospirillales bacterium]
MRQRIWSALALGAWLAAASPVAAQGTAEWDKTVAAAKAEGTVTLYTGLVGSPTSAALVKEFAKEYGVKVEVLEVRATELRERLRAEKVAGRHLADVMNTSNNQTRQLFAEDGTVQPFGAVPNQGRVRQAMTEAAKAPEIQLPIFGLYYAILANAKLVGDDTPKSWQDLLDPRWKGKILSDDMRAVGGGHTIFVATHDRFGADFHRRLAAQEPQFTRDMREAERRVARGEFAFYIPFLLPNAAPLKGLPVKLVIPDEGAAFTLYTASMVKDAPHPNAARLLISFMISDEGQRIYAKEGFGMVVDGLDDAVPPEFRDIASPKLLGSSDFSTDPEMYALAREIYK